MLKGPSRRPPGYNCFSDFDFTPNWNWLIFDVVFFCSVREMKRRREKFPIRFPTYHLIPAIRQFFSVHFILLLSLDFLIFYHSLAEWVKSPSLAVHLNFNNFCRPALCRSLCPLLPFILVSRSFLLRRINKWIQLFIRKTRANIVDSLSFAIFQISSQTTQQNEISSKKLVVMSLQSSWKISKKYCCGFSCRSHSWRRKQFSASKCVSLAFSF